MPEPQSPRGEVPEAGVSKPPPEEPSNASRPAETVEMAVQPEWPAEDPAATGDSSETGGDSPAEEAPGSDKAESGPAEADSAGEAGSAKADGDADDRGAEKAEASAEQPQAAAKGAGGGAAQASGDAEQPSEKAGGEAAWPTEDEAAVAAVQDAERPAERTQQFQRVELGADAGRDAERPAERTQQFQRVEPEQPTNRLGRKDLDQGTNPISRGELSAAEKPREEPSTPPSGLRVDPAPPAARALPIQMPEPERTQQFARPDFSQPPPEPPRAATPQDYSETFTAPSPADDPTRPAWERGPEYPQPETRAEPLRLASAKPASPSASRKPRRWLLVAVALLVVAGVGAAVVFGARNLGGPTIADPPPPVRLHPEIKPISNSGPAPGPQGVASVLAGPASNPALGTFAGTVLDPTNGRALWQRNNGQALVPASTGKLLMASAAMLTLDHQHRFSTKVVRGTQPGSIVLVGGGDPSLSALPDGRDSVYPGAPRLDDLVTQVKAATGGQVTSISVDTRRYAGPSSAPGWLPSDVPGGYVSPIEPVMLEGGRADASKDVSARSQTPALDTGRELASRLGLPASAVTSGSAPPGAPMVGEVKSATVQEMVETVLQHSDNVLAEALAREVAISTGNEPSFAGGVKAVREVLQRNGFDLTGINMVDGSGLSQEDRVTPQLLGSLLAAATAPEGPDGGLAERSAKLRALLPGLPVAGGSGSLADRYQNAGSTGRGWVRAKTGTLSSANSLAGTVVTQDGRLLVFALMSNGSGSDTARPALDEVAAALHSCGCR